VQTYLASKICRKLILSFVIIVKRRFFVVTCYIFSSNFWFQHRKVSSTKLFDIATTERLIVFFFTDVFWDDDTTSERTFSADIKRKLYPDQQAISPVELLQLLKHDVCQQVNSSDQDVDSR